MAHTDNDFFNDVAKLADKIKCLADDAYLDMYGDSDGG